MLSLRLSLTHQNQIPILLSLLVCCGIAGSAIIETTAFIQRYQHLQELSRLIDTDLGLLEKSVSYLQEQVNLLAVCLTK